MSLKMDTANMDDSVEWLLTNVSFEFNYEFESEYAPDMSYRVDNYIYPIVIVLSIISCLLITASIFSQRTLRSPFFYVMLSWMIANVLHVAIILSTEWMQFRQQTWSLGESACRAVRYLRLVFLCVKAYHMPLAVIVACLTSKIEGRFKERPWVANLVPIIACSYIWIIVLLSCIPYIGWAAQVNVVLPGQTPRYVCVDKTFNTAFFVEMLLHYVLPIVLSLALLLVLGCLFIRRPGLFGNPKRQTVEVMSISVIIHAFILLNAASYGAYWYAISGGGFTNDTIIATQIFHYIHLSDFVIAPCICLSLPLFRNVFCMPCTFIRRCKRDENQTSAFPLEEGVDMVEPTII